MLYPKKGMQMLEMDVGIDLGVQSVLPQWFLGFTLFTQ